MDAKLVCEKHGRLLRVRGCILIWLACWLAGAGCVGWAAESRLQVVTSFMPIYSFAVQVAGKDADVQNLLPGNVGPHEYQPSRSDHEKLRSADVFLINGLKLEDWVIPMTKGRRPSKPLKVVEVSKGLEAELIYELPTLQLGKAKQVAKVVERGVDPNPHIWLDPQLAMRMVTNILNSLRSGDPQHATNYEQNAAACVDRLRRLDAEYRERLSPIAATPIITSHDAFVYLARRYGLNVLGVIELVPEVGPSLKYQGQLKHLIQTQGVKVIFGEPQSPGKTASQLAADTGVRLASLDTLETADAKGLRPSAYEDAMRENLKTLVENLK